jgi:formylglycine-generating enzyme required for sulfatase activity
MSGNVWEWCWDWYDYSPTANDGSDSPVLDPLGGAALGAYYRVIRGIGWDTHYDFNARVLYRWYTYSNNYGKNTNVGFRLVCPAE